MKQYLVALLCALLAPIAGAQMQVATVHVRVLNGRNGKPVRDAETETMMLPQTTFSSPIEGRTDAKGTMSLLAVTSREIAVTMPHHATCEYKRKSDRKTKGPSGYPVQQILSTGVIGANACSKRKPVPTPGELIVFVRPPHWWERIGF